jgi:hypothetical protein
MPQLDQQLVSAHPSTIIAYHTNMHQIGPYTIATWICVILVLLVLIGVLRTVARPLVVVAVIAVVLIALGVWRADTVAHVARVVVHDIYRFVASLFGAAHA